MSVYGLGQLIVTVGGGYVTLRLAEQREGSNNGVCERLHGARQGLRSREGRNPTQPDLSQVDKIQEQRLLVQTIRRYKQRSRHGGL